MKKLSRAAQLYIVSVILVGGGLTAWHIARLTGIGVWTLLATCALASLAQVLKVEGATERSSYNTAWVVYAFAFALLGPSAAVFVMLVSHVVEWAWYKYPWYIQLFNIGMYVLCFSVAGVLLAAFPGSQSLGNLLNLTVFAAALGAFTFLNHLLVGLVVHLARGQNFKASGVFDRMPLVIDYTLLVMGTGAALLWRIQPGAALLAVIPLYLIYATLRIPALQRQTQVDAKTGLYNARHFTESLQNELSRADRFDRPLTVVMADLDLLRNINNTYGHLAGDVVLIGVANLLAKAVREYDLVARFGGEEFAILMPETTPEQAIPRIEMLRAAVEAATFQVSTSVTPIQVTMSFGLAGRERVGQTPEALVHQADLAVYQAKLAGRNRVCLQTPLGAVLPVTPVTVAPAPPGALPPLEHSAPAPEAPGSSALPPAPAAPLMPVAQARPAWATGVYVTAVAASALGLLAVFRPDWHVDWFGLALMAIIVALTEWLAIEIYVRDTSISTAAAPLLAGALLFGPVGVLVLSVVQAIAAGIKHRSKIYRSVFNASNEVIAGLAVYGLAQWLGWPFAGQSFWMRIAVTVLGAGVVYLSTTLLVAGAIDVSSGQPIRRVWVERFRWLWLYYLALGLVAYALVFGYLQAGLWGVVVVLVPLFMLRLSQQQYLQHTQASVTQLRESNTTLQHQAAEISALNEELLLALSQAIDLRDPDVHNHSQNVARYAVLLAQQLGLPPERVELVRKAGLLHDIGKLGIPEVILFKPAHLDAAEYQTVRQHPNLGAEIVDNCHSLHNLVPFIRHHHERIDGQGYPDGLQAADIPLEARILSVADAVEAMASDRPYRRGQGPAAIVAEVQAHAGTQFDAAVVEALVKVVQRAGPPVIVNSARLAVPPSAPTSFAEALFTASAS